MELEPMLKALGDPTRLKIFQALLERKHCVRSLSKKLGITESAISQHLRLMREAGLIYGEKFSHHTHCFPRQDAVDFLSRAFSAMQAQSLSLDRDTTVCQCEFRKDGLL